MDQSMAAWYEATRMVNFQHTMNGGFVSSEFQKRNDLCKPNVQCAAAAKNASQTRVRINRA